MTLALNDYRRTDFEGFVRYAKARVDDRREEALFRTYLTEAVRLTPLGKAIPKPMAKYLDVRREKESAESIIERVTREAGLEVVG